MLEMLNRIRFLPVTIFTAAMLLTVKLGEIWQGVDGYLNQATVAVASAEAQQGASTSGAAPPPATPTPGAAPAADPAAAGAEPAATKDFTAEDPTLLTQAEIDLLQQLAARRDALDTREKELNDRLTMLTAAEARIDKKIVELQRYKDTVEGLLKQHEKEQAEKLDGLVKLYSNMKPKDAARIFEELEMDTLLMVAERMTSRKLAPIMAKMNPTKAREVTVELYRLRQLPTPGATSEP